MRDVQRVLRRRPQRGLQVTSEDGLARTRALNHGKGYRWTCRLGIGLAPHPDKTIPLHRRVRRDVPGRLDLVTTQTRNPPTLPATVKAPPVVAAFQEASASDPP